LPPKVKSVKILLASKVREKLEIVKERGEPRRAGRAAPIQAGESLPPSAAKNVRTIFKIVHKGR